MILKIAGLALLVFVAAFYIVPLMRESRKRRGWSQVAAQVLEQRLRESGGHGFPEYRVRYAWHGEEHERFVGSRSRHGAPLFDPDGGGTDMRDLIKRKMARRAVGSVTRIEVNPANPAEAYLVEAAVAPSTIAWILGAIFLLFFVVFAFIAFA